MKAYNQVVIKAVQDDVDNNRLANLPAGTIVVMPNNEVRVVDSTGNANAIQTSGNQPLNNFTATTNPTVSDDSGDGYAKGSFWINTSTSESFVCLTDTVGSAVWELITADVIADITNLQTSLNAKQDAALAATDAELATHTGNVSNPHAVTKAQVGLGNAENTNDLSKPISTATQTALNGKANTAHTHPQSDVTNLTTDLAAKAPLASPTFTGTPAAPTPAIGTNTTQLATTAFVLDAVTASQAGLDWKQSVRVATTANITLSGTQTIDGIAVVAGNRVLVKDQTTASQNGLYDVAAGAWVRSADANANNEVSAGMVVYVEEGSTLATSVWTLVTAGNISLGTTVLTFSRLFNTSGLQQTLVSGTNIKTVNGSSLLGAGDVAIAADLPGGTTATALDDGLDSGNSTVDRATVAGQTILKYTTAGASTFKVPLGVTSLWVLAIGGGGAGGSSHSGGGGGAGRFVENSALTVTPGQTLAPTVAAGGVGSAGAVWASASAGIGGNSSLGTTVIASGGGRGAYGDETANTSNLEDATFGGSGGAGSGGNADHLKAGQPATGGTSTGGASPDTTGFGFAGGTGSQTGATYGVAGGGGGAGAAGANGVGANGSTGSAGGAGRASSITGVAVNYAGGGGGGGWSAAGGSGGIGGGGVGGQNDGVGAGSAGTANTGGGGGGSNAAGTSRTGGNGGSGIVIVRFTTQSRSYKALSSFADNASAVAGGLLIGQFYRETATNAVRQVQ